MSSIEKKCLHFLYKIANQNLIKNGIMLYYFCIKGTEETDPQKVNTLKIKSNYIDSESFNMPPP